MSPSCFRATCQEHQIQSDALQCLEPPWVLKNQNVVGLGPGDRSCEQMHSPLHSETLFWADNSPDRQAPRLMAKRLSRANNFIAIGDGTGLLCLGHSGLYPSASCPSASQAVEAKHGQAVTRSPWVWSGPPPKPVGCTACIGMTRHVQWSAELLSRCCLVHLPSPPIGFWLNSANSLQVIMST